MVRRMRSEDRYILIRQTPISKLEPCGEIGLHLHNEDLSIAENMMLQVAAWKRKSRTGTHATGRPGRIGLYTGGRICLYLEKKSPGRLQPTGG